MPQLIGSFEPTLIASGLNYQTGASKMKTYTNEEIIAKCSEIWHPISPYRDFKIVVHCNTPDVVIITIRQMYEYVELNLKHLLALAKFFETENINDSRYHSSGCETCDYGSSYEITLTIKPELTK